MRYTAYFEYILKLNWMALSRLGLDWKGWGWYDFHLVIELGGDRCESGNLDRIR
jgi:hypothetical protein